MGDKKEGGLMKIYQLNINFANWSSDQKVYRVNLLLPPAPVPPNSPTHSADFGMCFLISIKITIQDNQQITWKDMIIFLV